MKKILIIIGLFFLIPSKEGKALEAKHCNDFEALIAVNDIYCNTLQVPENHANPSGKQISIAYVVLKSKNKGSNNSPMIYFSGGPGGPSLSNGSLSYWLNSPIRDERAIVLFDQRGIGYSSALPNMNRGAFEIWAKDLKPEQELEETQKLVVKYKDIAKDDESDIPEKNEK